MRGSGGSAAADDGLEDEEEGAAAAAVEGLRAWCRLVGEAAEAEAKMEEEEDVFLCPALPAVAADAAVAVAVAGWRAMTWTARGLNMYCRPVI